MVKKVNFKPNSLRIFSEVLGDLKEHCFPPYEQIQPVIQICPAEDCLYSSYGTYTIEELNNSVQKKQTLPSHIKFIKTNGISWFYKDDDPFDFYSTKKHVSLGFSPQRLMNPKILKDRQIVNCIKKMLALLGQPNISETDVIKVFPEDIWRKVYELAPPREDILSCLTISIEKVRQTLFPHLKTHHEKDIQNLPEFQAFHKANPDKSVLDFLKKDYRGFSLAEKWGYIKNSKKLIEFQKLRNTPRHVSKFMKDPILSGETDSMTDEDWNRWIYHQGYPYQNPTELYNDFQKALFFVSPKKPQSTISYDDATCAIWAQKDIEKLKKILNTLSFEKDMETFLKKNFPNEVSPETVTIEKSDKTKTPESVTLFSTFFVKKNGIVPSEIAQEQPDGTLLFKEKDFHNWIHHAKTTAHAHEGYQESSKILSEDMQYLSDFVADLTDAFNQKTQSRIRMAKTTKCHIRNSGR